MSRLFLASAIDKVLHKLPNLVQLEPKSTRVAFIPNASIPYKQEYPDLWWVESDRKSFLEQGFELEEVDLDDFGSKQELRSKLETFDLIHVCGGHTIYLLKRSHETGFTEIIRDLLTKGNKIYTGTSAGSMVVTPSFVGMEHVDSDPIINAEFVGDFQNYEGINLVPFLIEPHFNNPDFSPSRIQTIQKTDYPYPLVFLADNQALWVENGKVEFVFG